MRVKMRTLYCGPDGIVQPGGEANLPTDEARALLERGYADPVARARPCGPAAVEQPVDDGCAQPPRAAGDHGNPHVGHQNSPW